MAYVDVNAPLPRNSLTPLSPCEIAAAKARIDSIQQSVANAQAAHAMIAPASSFAGLGQGVVNDVQRSQAELIAAQALKATPLPTTDVNALRNAPEQLPLNVSEQEFNGCAVRNVGALAPIPISYDQQHVVMPPRAPTDTNLLGGGVSVPGRGWGWRRYGGMGVVWGDAAGYHVPGAPAGLGLPAKSLLLLGLGALGLYAVTRKKR